MNKRIRLLAEQAGMRTVTYEYDEDTYFTDSLDPQKFAELLLKDVLAIVKNNTPNPDPYSRYGMQEAAERTANYIRDEIKDHFGIKE